MVFAINAPADPDPKSFKAFQERAIAINGTGSPGTTTAATTTAITTTAATTTAVTTTA
ncbi:hypothetical protein DXG03_009528, partial [Asterophora parasitica]